MISFISIVGLKLEEERMGLAERRAVLEAYYFV